MTILLGIDVGSSGCKVAAIHADGRLLACSRSFAYATSYARTGWAEQQPADWYAAACLAIRDCVERGNVDVSQIAALSVDGPAHNVALLGDEDRILRPTLHWSDLRSVAQAQWLEQTLGDEIFAATYQRPNPSWTLAQLLWLKQHEPATWSALRRVLVTKDYVRYRLTGRYATDVYDATGTQLYDVRSGCWSATLCELLGLSTDWLPEVHNALDHGGVISHTAAHETGLPSGLPVAIGSGDSVVEAAGIGVTAPGRCVVKLGTAANVNLVTAQPQPAHTSITYPHVVDGHWFTIAATNSGTATMRWFGETLFGNGQFANGQSNGQAQADVYTQISELASTVTPGSEGLIFHPYLMGERSPYWDPHLRGDFIGISARHSLPHFARAMLEGVAFSIRDCMDAVEALGQPITERRLLGGGSRSPLWRQLLCDVLGRPLIKPAVEDAAFGAALLAGVAVGVFDSWQQAIATCVRDEAILEPNSAVHERYSRYFAIFKDVVRDLAVHDRRLVALAEDAQ